MRLNEAEIKAAILHPMKLVRTHALRYFSGCFSRDVEVMPLAIQAMETFDREEAFVRLDELLGLAQTEATVDWIIRELHGGRTRDRGDYFFDLSQVLFQADARLVLPRKTEIIQAPAFDIELIDDFEERLQLATWHAEQCWRELEKLAEQWMSLDGFEEEIEFDRAVWLVETLAPQAANRVDRIVELLDKKIMDFDEGQMVWMEIFMVMLAGEMRLEQAIPAIVKKLLKDGDYLLEEAEDALCKIGTDRAADEIAAHWPKGSWEYRLCAGGALEYIHTNTTVRRCLELMPAEKHEDIRTILAAALLNQYTAEAIEPVRGLVSQEAYDSSAADLMGDLVAVSTVLGVTFPEYSVWKQEAEQELATQEISGLGKAPEFEQSTESPRRAWRTESAEPLSPAFSQEYLEERRVPIVRAESKVGRNDPCPCGSGKKFKKCCMNRDKS